MTLQRRLWPDDSLLRTPLKRRTKTPIMDCQYGWTAGGCATLTLLQQLTNFADYCIVKRRESILTSRPHVVLGPGGISHDEYNLETLPSHVMHGRGESSSLTRMVYRHRCSVQFVGTLLWSSTRGFHLDGCRVGHRLQILRAWVRLGGSQTFRSAREGRTTIGQVGSFQLNRVILNYRGDWLKWFRPFVMIV